MNGSDSSSPLPSRVARIWSSVRTWTTSPTRRSSTRPSWRRSATIVLRPVLAHREGSRLLWEGVGARGGKRTAAPVVAERFPLVEAVAVVAGAHESVPGPPRSIRVPDELGVGRLPIAARVAVLYLHASHTPLHTDVVVVDVDVVDVRQPLTVGFLRPANRLGILVQQDAVVVAPEEIGVHVHVGAVGDEDPGAVEGEILWSVGGLECFVPVDLRLARYLVEQPPAIVGLEAVGADDDVEVVDVEPEPAAGVVVEPGILHDHAGAEGAGEFRAAGLPVGVERQRLVVGDLGVAQDRR